MRPVSMNSAETAEQLRRHIEALTVQIGERSIQRPENLQKAQDYIESAYKDIGLETRLESYAFRGLPVANVVSRIDFCRNPSRTYLLGAHYDTVKGTAGADDNASAVAVQLETSRLLKMLSEQKVMDLSVKFVSFTLEEKPAFLTPYRGSKIHAGKAREEKEPLEGAICLEMVGYRSMAPGSQKYPLPLRFAHYPREGNYISIVGNTKSRAFTRSILDAFSQNPELPAISLTVPLNGWLIPAVRRSDHISFWDQGFKAVMITDTANYRNPHYHERTDTMETLDFDFMSNVVKSLMLFFSSSK